MANIVSNLDSIMDAMNTVLWHDYVLFTVLGVGVLFTIWSGFAQYWSLTHGIAVIRGKYDKKSDPGAINHFQALSAALSATIGLGNIGGVALAITLGGPGAVFWMWVVGIIGMALKTTEVTQAMMFRNTSDPDNPHGGAMWVAKKGFEKLHPSLGFLGIIIGGIFCVTVLVSTVTGGNMFQSWNVGILFWNYFHIPMIFTGIILAVLVGAVIIGGIKRIGAVAGRLVPFMCAIYLLASAYVLIVKFSEIPALFHLIFSAAFNPLQAQGAFLGGTAGMAFMWGMKRALFSNEAGQGSSPMAHSAAKTEEPVREGVVGGLGPFIDTIIVCTLTALVILASGVWDRGPEANFTQTPEVVQTQAGLWSVNSHELPTRQKEAEALNGPWKKGDGVFTLLKGENGKDLRLDGDIKEIDGKLGIQWQSVESSVKPGLEKPGIYATYAAAAMTSYAFDRVKPGLGEFMVPLAAFLFAISTMISWSYYGEQGVIFLFSQRAVLPYKVLYCLLIILACSGIVTTSAELDNLTGIGTGVMLFANIPIMLIFGAQAMKAYRTYIRKLRAGEFKAHAAPQIVDVIEGTDTKDDD